MPDSRPHRHLLATLLLLATGCAQTARRPAEINHVVLVRLQDPADVPAALADCDALLPGIPGVVAYAAGTHLETGREAVRDDYDFGLYIGFNTVEDYDRYIDHPDHQALLERWGPRLREIIVYDIARAR